MGNKKSKETKEQTLTLPDNRIKLLIANTDFTRDQIIEWHHEFMKDCPNGKLNKKKFIEVYRKFYPNGRPDAFCEQIFRTFDKDQNNYVDFEEFLIAISIASQTDLTKKLHWVFKIYDIDDNGRIDKKEFKIIIQSIIKLLADSQDKRKLMATIDERVDQLFNKMDFDQNKYITLDEFIIACKSNQDIYKLLAPS